MIYKNLKFGDRATWKREEGKIKCIFLYENAAGCMVEGQEVQGYANREELFVGWKK